MLDAEGDSPYDCARLNDSVPPIGIIEPIDRMVGRSTRYLEYVERAEIQAFEIRICDLFRVSCFGFRMSDLVKFGNFLMRDS